MFCPRDGFALVAASVLADADGDPFLGMTIAGRYVVLGRIGAGSMGAVYRARDVTRGQDVAVKVFRGDRGLGTRALSRLDREARVLSMLRSPHTVQVLDVGEIVHGGEDALVSPTVSRFLVMEMLEGEPLGVRLRREGRLSIAEATRLATHALTSLAEAHEKGIVHRDLKPDNVFIARLEGGAEAGKLLDFGLADLGLPPRDPKEAALGWGSGPVGTPRYMSPEQARGEPVDARSDLYAVGALLYQMLVGRPPFVERDAARVMAKHVHEPPIAPCDAAPEAGIPRALVELVVRALCKRPEDRPSSARVFIAAIEEALAGGPGGGAARHAAGGREATIRRP
ncbi:serine/threonine-protein kinase [Polyangium jinanense]|uniref:Serine/threonine protein kinase n=1 Tax=Polyangium jinanense TaxID=2829994 RepID=A0A9X3X710_9BACT|nr:serine/threonine-protein kinase [Polyangium jinanense]MDC3959127.1 serine/threonine protein kinase [Polyangium jinanense]MDC3983950.1 serine/threonine protein kinase [Polyangium jinanense]